MKIRGLLVVLTLAFSLQSARAEVKPHALCSEGMILQQKAPATIWGTADKGETVTVSFRGQLVIDEADEKGNWSVSFPAGKAGGPFELTIKGKNTIVYKNVLVGEVWICSGQSNMEAKVGNNSKSDKDYATSAPHNPMLRHYTVKRTPQATPQTETGGAWVDADPKTVGSFTAVGYFFGRSLQEKLKVPVGLIHTSWGGTPIEAWMSSDALTAAGVKGGAGKGKIGPNTPSSLYNGMIAPLLNYRVQGAIWYQGESNAGNAYAYRKLHPGMIESWRKEWSNPNLAFYFVQLAPYTKIATVPGNSDWAELREAQTMTLKLKNTGMAVITDFGNENDIHPTPKRPVGERLALAALAKTYGQKIVYSGPMYKAVKFDGDKAILSFDHLGGGLISQELALDKNSKGNAWRVKEGSNGAPLTGFTLCGKDQKFQPAKAEIVGDTVVVTSELVPEPVAVRYGWANHPLCNLFNREGLPASPFRTDDFPGITQPKQK